jgi:hypothetical protein
MENTKFFVPRFLYTASRAVAHSALSALDEVRGQRTSDGRHRADGLSFRCEGCGHEPPQRHHQSRKRVPPGAAARARGQGLSRHGRAARDQDAAASVSSESVGQGEEGVRTQTHNTKQADVGGPYGAVKDQAPDSRPRRWPSAVHHDRPDLWQPHEAPRADA